jgi:hypothetical protein
VIVAAVADRRRRFRLQLLCGFLALLLIAYARQLLSSPTVGQDFRAFYAGAVVLRAGGNPYDWAALGATEDALYNAPHHLRGGDPGYYDFLPLPEGPWLLMALLPLTAWPWPAANAAYTGLLLVIMVGGSWLILHLLGWTGRPLLLGLFVVTLSPVVFINLFLGQATPLIFGAMAAALALVARGRPGLAGLVLAVVWIKPNLGLALPVVVGLYQGRHAGRLLAGFAIGTAGAFAIAAAALGRALIDWPRGVIQVWRSVQGPQPDIASLHSFYYPLLGGWVKTAALLLACLLIAAYGLWALRRSPARPLSSMTFLVLWLCAIPYAHSFDAILLLPVLAILIAPTLAGLKDPWVEITLFAFALFPLFYFLGAHLGPLNGFGAIPVALTAWAWHRRIVAPSPASLRMAA